MQPLRSLQSLDLFGRPSRTRARALARARGLPPNIPMAVGCAPVAAYSHWIFFVAACARASARGRACASARARRLPKTTPMAGSCALAPRIIPMAEVCAGVAFSAPGPAPRAPCCPELFQWL